MKSDIDECAAVTSGCNQICTNTIGSYTCSCYPGYDLINGTICQGEFSYEPIFQQYPDYPIAIMTTFSGILIEVDTNGKLILNCSKSLILISGKSLFAINSIDWKVKSKTHTSISYFLVHGSSANSWYVLARWTGSIRQYTKTPCNISSK